MPTQEHQGPQAQRETATTEALEQFTAVSSSDPNKTYQVTLHPNDRWSCTCPHHMFRKAICNHSKSSTR